MRTPTDLERHDQRMRYAGIVGQELYDDGVRVGNWEHADAMRALLQSHEFHTSFVKAVNTVYLHDRHPGWDRLQEVAREVAIRYRTGTGTQKVM